MPEGWLSDEEAAELRRIATGKTVLELGAWKGKSTVVLAKAAEYVVSVDRHRGIPEAGGGDSLPDYLAAVRKFANVAIVVADFELFVPHLRLFDLVYVDGNHDRESVARDAKLAGAHAAEMIAFHDWDFKQVREGALAVMKSSPDRIVGSLAVFT